MSAKYLNLLITDKFSLYTLDGTFPTWGFGHVIASSGDLFNCIIDDVSMLLWQRNHVLTTICCCLLCSHMMYQLTVDRVGIIAWGWFTTATWWRWVEALWVGPAVDIQVTEWVNVKIKFSDGEKTGMWARFSHWHDLEIYYWLEWLDLAPFWLDSRTVGLLTASFLLCLYFLSPMELMPWSWSVLKWWIQKCSLFSRNMSASAELGFNSKICTLRSA